MVPLSGICISKGVESGPAGPVLAGPQFIKVNAKFYFAKSK